jgi:hypothetical protein
MNNPIYLLGPAGCGKSTLTQALADAFRSRGLKTLTVNLDPGAEWLPYTPEIDVRTYVSLREVMREFRLGPNGALVVSVDLMINHLPKLRELILGWGADYVMIDTPGQMELFAFRETGPAVVEGLSPGGSPLILFLIDSFFTKKASSFISMLMLATSVLTRFRAPQLNVLTKVDLLSEEETEKAVSWLERRDLLLEAIDSEPNPLDRENTCNILEAIDRMGFVGEILPISATQNKGILELVTAIERVFAAEAKLDLGEEVEKY